MYDNKCHLLQIKLAGLFESSIFLHDLFLHSANLKTEKNMNKAARRM